MINCIFVVYKPSKNFELRLLKYFKYSELYINRFPVYIINFWWFLYTYQVGGASSACAKILHFF